jgi:hypothetical protein
MASCRPPITQRPFLGALSQRPSNAGLQSSEGLKANGVGESPTHSIHSRNHYLILRMVEEPLLHYKFLYIQIFYMSSISADNLASGRRKSGENRKIGKNST